VLNQLLKFTLVSSALLWLRPRWQGLLALAVAVMLVHVFHGEYLEYVQLSHNDDHLVLSYVIKWMALILVAAIYLAHLLFGAKSTKKKKPGNQQRSEQSLSRGSASSDDGFDFLRKKKRLDTRAEKVIAGKPGERR